MPSYVKNRSPEVKKGWIESYTKASEAYGVNRGQAIANTWLKSHVVIKPTTTVKAISFKADTSKGFIKRTESGEEYIDFMLTDNLPDSKGVQYPDYLLKKWADEVNLGKTLVGDIDHQAYDRVMDGAYSREEILELLGQDRGIAKGIKAIYENGKLWIRALIDKRYSKRIRENAKGVSLEALLTYNDETQQVVDGTLAGFTFAVANTPVNPRAAIA